MLSVNRTPRLFSILSRSHPLLFLCSFFTVCVERRVFCEAGAFAVVKSLQGELGNFLTSLVMLFTLSTVVWQFFFSDFFCISKLMLKISACFSKLMSKTDFQFKFRLFSRFQSKPFSVCFVLLRRLSFFFSSPLFLVSEEEETPGTRLLFVQKIFFVNQQCCLEILKFVSCYVLPPNPEALFQNPEPQVPSQSLQPRFQNATDMFCKCLVFIFWCFSFFYFHMSSKL